MGALSRIVGTVLTCVAYSRARQECLPGARRTCCETRADRTGAPPRWRSKRAVASRTGLVPSLPSLRGAESVRGERGIAAAALVERQRMQLLVAPQSRDEEQRGGGDHGHDAGQDQRRLDAD